MGYRVGIYFRRSWQCPLNVKVNFKLFRAIIDGSSIHLMANMWGIYQWRPIWFPARPGLNRGPGDLYKVSVKWETPFIECHHHHHPERVPLIQQHRSLQNSGLFFQLRCSNYPYLLLLSKTSIHSLHYGVICWLVVVSGMLLSSMLHSSLGDTTIILETRMPTIERIDAN